MFGLIRFLLTGWMLRILIVAAVIYGLYFYQIWPFNKNVANMEYLQNKYCQNTEPQAQAICNCVLQKVQKDWDNRFTKEERDALANDRLKGAYALQRSMQIIKVDAQDCLKKRGQEPAWRQFTTDLATLDNKLLGKIGGLVNSGVDMLKEEWESRKEEKAEIDSKY